MKPREGTEHEGVVGTGEQAVREWLGMGGWVGWDAPCTLFRACRRSELRGGGGKRVTGGQGGLADAPRLWVGWSRWSVDILFGFG